MKTKVLKFSSLGFIAVSALSLLYVSMLAFFDPQKVMDLVQVKLNTTDAYSSIRGVYGGVGLMIVTMLVVFSVRNRVFALLMLALLWGMYSISRVITIVNEGALGTFGNQWLITETLFFFIAAALLAMHTTNKKAGS